MKKPFKKRPEPNGILKPKGRARLFVIQKHYARNLHFDFRLSHFRSLKSWVVPKGLSKLTKDKRLAIQVEDHPLSYARFEGTIPEGQYGAGKVKIWDSGVYYNLTQDENGKLLPMRHCLKEGHLIVWLEGGRYKGAYVLHRFNQEQWLIIKMKKR